MEELLSLAQRLVTSATERNQIIAIAESCTGGLVSHAITSIPGASAILDRSFVAYSYEAKIEMLGVSPNILYSYGAVSEECVEEMVLGVIKNSHAQFGVAISGIAGPTGGTADKPIGTVYFAYFDKIKNRIKSERQTFTGDRKDVIIASSKRALELFLQMLNEH